MANKDLRDWIEGVKAAGELKTIHGAEPKEEIGGIVDIYQRRTGNQAVLFDDIPDRMTPADQARFFTVFTVFGSPTVFLAGVEAQQRRHARQPEPV